MSDGNGQPINSAVDDDLADENENDSALGDIIAGLSTTSIGSSILTFPEENGRTYHAYKAGRYPWPNDEAERDRLDLQHHTFLFTFDQKLHLAPLPERVGRVLDVGTGTGIWAMDFADAHPESEVLGIDLSPIQPVFLPPNLKFEVDDLESDWTFSHPFTFIYSRMMMGSFSNWPKFINQCFANLEPGGYIELTELTFPPVFPSPSSPSTAPSDPSPLLQWNAHLLSTSALLSRPICPSFCIENLLESSGFVSIESHHFSWPINGWPTDPKEKELGEWCLANFDRGLSGLSMALFTREEGGLGWSRESTEVFLVGVRREIRDKRRKGVWEGKVLCARKPWD